MNGIIAIRAEDPRPWETRTPIIPADVAALAGEHGVRTIVEPSPTRVFSDDAFRAAGARLSADLGDAGVVFGVKVMPSDVFLSGRTYVFFAHVIKGQPLHMPMLRVLMDRGATLVDYERITDASGRRLVFFGVHAGHAGMIETLWTLGRRLAGDGIETPLWETRHAWEYGRFETALAALRRIGAELARIAEARPSARPIVIGMTGDGNVARGAMEVLDALPARDVTPADLPMAATAPVRRVGPLLRVVFREPELVRPRDSGHPFELEDYYRRPDGYEGRFEEWLPHLDAVVNGIYWDERYPRLVTREWARSAFADGGRPRLRVIGDISCDINGAIEFTTRATRPDAPAFVYDPVADRAVEGIDAPGIAVMAVDNLPSELPEESSRHFSRTLLPLIPALARADWTEPLARLGLPPCLAEAVVVHRGELTADYRYLEDAVGAVEAERA